MKNNLLFIVFDSCRFDSFAAAHTPNISRLGPSERCFSYASWTVPSHAVYLSGVGPHRSPKDVFASEVYKQDFRAWSTRLNIPDISFRGFLPRLSLPAFLKAQGYRANALVSLPVLNEATILNSYFDSYKLMPAHNDFSAMLDELRFDDPSEPCFYLLNVGETHYPYTVSKESADELPILHGVHGVLGHLDDLTLHTAIEGDNRFSFDPTRMAALKDKQRQNVEYLDALFERLYECVPKNTYIIVTSDHGELFGEEGYFGHGPVMHEKVFEIFAVEGLVP